MNKYEKLILFLVLMVVAEKFGYLLRDLIYVIVYGVSFDVDNTYFQKSTYVFKMLVNIGSAIWVYSEARSIYKKAYIWSLLGLVFNISGIILFYLIVLFHKDQGGMPSRDKRISPLEKK